MQNQVINKSSTSSPIYETYPPWNDLPNPLFEHVLECLPLSDYIRFAAVCKKWQSIQKSHILLYSPSSPPMLPLPLLIPCEQEQDLMVGYSPFEHRFYRFQLPHASNKRRFASSHGWFLLLDPDIPSSCHWSLNLVDPISSTEIQLPPLIKNSTPFFGCMSSAPTEINCVVMIVGGFHILLWLVGESDWIRLPVPHHSIVTVIFCKGKFYCKCYDGRLLVVDLLFPNPTIQELKMDWNLIQSAGCLDMLVEFNGNVLLVRPISEHSHMKGFLVFEAELLRKKWVRVESLGKHAIILGRNFSFSLRATDVGCRENSVYFPERLFLGWLSDRATPGQFSPWKRFELKTKRVIDERFEDIMTECVCSQFQKYGLSWIVPTLFSNNLVAL